MSGLLVMPGTVSDGVLSTEVPVPHGEMFFPCCDHCGCDEIDGVWTDCEGHEDTCARGCNDDGPFPFPVAVWEEVPIRRGTGCDGPCDGVGRVPVYLAEGDHSRRSPMMVATEDEEDIVLIDRWREMERQDPTDDGWHFPLCPVCDGVPGIEPLTVGAVVATVQVTGRSRPDYEGVEVDWCTCAGPFDMGVGMQHEPGCGTAAGELLGYWTPVSEVRWLDTPIPVERPVEERWSTHNPFKPLAPWWFADDALADRLTGATT